ncbi:MAG: circadian clock protein KaiB [Methanotrichaceae archaeon]|nr:circadian clock protein KaiB [Methanotrichaceae archaeon]
MNCENGSIALKLYVASGTPNSVLALRNLQTIIDDFLQGHHTLEIIDVFKEPSRAIADGILVTPSLVKLSPPPRISIIGNLSDREAVLVALDLGEPR